MKHEFAKSCRTCWQVLPHTAYRVSREHPDGLEPVCRRCRETGETQAQAARPTGLCEGRHKCVWWRHVWRRLTWWRRG